MPGPPLIVAAPSPPRVVVPRRAGRPGGRGLEPAGRRRSAPRPPVPAGAPEAPRAPLPLREVASLPGRSLAPGARSFEEDLPPPRRRLPLAVAALHGLLALFWWGALGGVLYWGDPRISAARGAFFVALFGALFFTLAPLLRALAVHLSSSRVYQQAAGAHATRQALLLATFACLNALLLLVRAWSGLNALLLFGTFAVIEVVALSRR